MRIQLDVLVWRGTIAESRHRLQAVVCTPAGETVLESEQAGQITSFRSSAKPFQVLPLVERGHLDRWGFGEEHLAVMCASHTGSARHLELVREILERIDLSPEDLACGFHPPKDPASLEALARDPGRRSKLYNNCSGKHAGMLCLARSEGWPIRGYETADHPVQRLMREVVAEMAGVPAASLGTGVDGCSAITFGLPLGAMARAFARLGAARAAGDGREAALARIRTAMVRYPVVVGGEDELTTQLMQAGGGAILAKGGAEGLQCLALPHPRLGLAVKAEDGAARGLGPAVAAVLDLLAGDGGQRPADLDEIRRPIVRNYAGDEVGHLEAAVRHLAPIPASGA